MGIKKEFEEPTIKVVVLESRNIICCSPGGDSNNDGIVFGGADEDFDD